MQTFSKSTIGTANSHEYSYYPMKHLKLITCVIAVAAPKLLHAYVGPGVGLSAIGSVLAFIGAVFLLIAGFLWYPIKRILKRKPKDELEGEPGTQEDGER